MILLEAPVSLTTDPLTIRKFDLKKRKEEKLADDVDAFVLSANGSKMLFRQGTNWRIAPTEELKPDNVPLKLADMQV